LPEVFFSIPGSKGIEEEKNVAVRSRRKKIKLLRNQRKGGKKEWGKERSKSLSNRDCGT